MISRDDLATNDGVLVGRRRGEREEEREEEREGRKIERGKRRERDRRLDSTRLDSHYCRFTAESTLYVLRTVQ
jgi:hypothetical protein